MDLQGIPSLFHFLAVLNHNFAMALDLVGLLVRKIPDVKDISPQVSVAGDQPSQNTMA